MENRVGSIEVIVGGMYSGKTEELIRRLRRAQLARQQVQVFKPAIDKRYHEADVTSHNLNSVPATPVTDASEIIQLVDQKSQVVGIDEGQFFKSNIIQVVQDLAQMGFRVIVAGLDTDWKAMPFEPMPTLMAIAESVTKQHAVCVVCGNAASRTQRVLASEQQVMVGSHGMYEARCRLHFRPEVVTPHLVEPSLNL